MRISYNIKLMAQVGSFSLLGVLFLICDVQTVQASILTKPANNLGIVAYYPFKEGSGTTTSDYSGQNLNATLTTAPAWTASGKYGYGLDFTSGSFQYLSVPHNAALNFSYAMTYAAWIKPTLGTQVSLLSKGAYGDAFRVLIQGGTAPERVLAIQIDGATIYGTTPIVSGNWTHIAFTYDGVNTKIYVNGALTDTSTLANGILATTATTMYIGQGGSDNIYYNGIMDEVYLFQRALSGAEISTLYARVPTGGRQRTVVSKQSYNNGLVFYAPLDDASGENARNYGSSGNMGTLKNFLFAGDISNWYTGMRNGSLAFDGSNDIVNFGRGSPLFLRSNMSIFAWVKTSSTYQSIVSWGGSVTGGVANGQYGLSSFGALCGGAGRQALAINGNWRCSSTSFADGNWHHIGYTLDSSYNLQFYKDGATDSSVITNASGFSPGGDNNHLTFGADQDDGNYTFAYSGSLDEVRIYNRVLTSTEVSQLYADTGMRKLTVSTSQNTVAPANLTLWHTFDSPYLSMNNTLSTDRSGQGNNGTIANGPVATLGRVGQGLAFDGVDDYMSLPDVTATDLATNNFSISYWIKPKETMNSGTGRRDWVTKYLSYWFILNYPGSDGKLTFCVGAGSPSIQTTTTSWTAGKWYHIAVSWDGTNFRMYVDGVLESTAGGGGQGNTGNLLYIGGTPDVGNYTNAAFDDFRIYDKVLSDAEVLRLYNQ